MNIVLEFNNLFITSATTLLIVYMCISTIKEYIRSGAHIIDKKDKQLTNEQPILSSHSEDVQDTIAEHPSFRPSEIMQRAEELKQELILINKDNINNPPDFTFQHTSVTSPYLGQEFTEDVEIISDVYERELEDMYGRVRKDVED
jgi:hypothetical protein